MKSYAGNPNSIADSILELLYNPGLCAEVSKKCKSEGKSTIQLDQDSTRHTLYISKKQYVKQWQKNKEENWSKRKQRKQKKAKKYTRRDYKPVKLQEKTCICLSA